MQKENDEVEEASADKVGGMQETLPVLKQLRLGISRNYYAMANVFGLKRLQDYFQVEIPCAICSILIDPSAHSLNLIDRKASERGFIARS